MERDYNKDRRFSRSERFESQGKRGVERKRQSDENKSADRRGNRYVDRDSEERRERNLGRNRYPARERSSENVRRREYTPDTERRQSADRPERKTEIKREEYAEGMKRSRSYRPERVEKEENRRSDYKRSYSRVRKDISSQEKEELQRKHYSKKKILAHRLKNEDENAELRLNRYISMGGVCSRRDADELIVAGRVKVNGKVVQTVGMKVCRKDKVEVDDVQIFPEKKVYLVLNKPKDYVTTVEDPLERKTVMSLVENACKERIYPVGRLDRQTTGVLLFTNDGDLAKKLTHPKYDHKKIYHVFLDRPLEEADLEAIVQGIELEDGFIKADDISYASADRTEVGIEIHSGRNRIVRRIFEHFGYQIVKLDRVYFAGITKKNLPRGTWRFLTPKEVTMLKVY